MNDTPTPNQNWKVQKLPYDWYINTGLHVVHSRHELKTASEAQLNNSELTIDFLCRELSAVTEQLSEARDTIGMLTNTLRNNNDAGKAEYDELKDQRDRLAEALEICERESEKMLIETKGYVNLLAWGIKSASSKALQSLNPQNETE